MKARDIFGLLIRSVGVVIFLLGIWYLAFGVAQAGGMPQQMVGEMIAYFITGIPAVFLGIIFVRFGRQIVSFSYPEDRDDSDPAA